MNRLRFLQITIPYSFDSLQTNILIANLFPNFQGSSRPTKLTKSYLNSLGRSLMDHFLILQMHFLLHLSILGKRGVAKYSVTLRDCALEDVPEPVLANAFWAVTHANITAPPDSVHLHDYSWSWEGAHHLSHPRCFCLLPTPVKTPVS